MTRIMVLAASVAPLALFASAGPVHAQSVGNNGSNGSNASNWFTPGSGGNAGTSGDGFATGTNGGWGSTSGSGARGGGGSDSGGGGGGGGTQGAGGGGGGAGGAGTTVSASGTTTITGLTLGGRGGNGAGGGFFASNPGSFGGGGGGGGGGSGIVITGAIPGIAITVNAGVTVEGGQGGNGGAFNGNTTDASHNGRGDWGGNGITAALNSNVMTITNNGTIKGGVGGSGYGGSANGVGGAGIAGYNLVIVNNAGATIAGGTAPGGGAPSQAIYIAGGINSIVNAGTVDGRIELAGGTTTISGAYSGQLDVGYVTMNVTTGNATGFSAINVAGTINVGAARTLSTVGALNHSGVLTIGSGAEVSAGSIKNTLYGQIRFDAAGSGARLSSTGNILNNNIIAVVNGDAVINGDIDNRLSVEHSAIDGHRVNGQIQVTGGDLSGIGTLANHDGGVVNVAAGRKLSLDTLTMNSGTLAGTGTIEAATAINLTIAGTFGNAFTGTGVLTKTGTGTVILTGANTYSGGTTVTGGTLQVGTTTATSGLAGSIAVASGTTLNIVNAVTSGLTGITNEGTTYFDRASSAGDATITNDGTMIFLATSTAGTADITNNNTLAFNTSSTAGGSHIANTATLNLNNSSKAGTAGITNSSTGLVNFNDASSADGATITHNAGRVQFFGTSTAGTASITNGFDVTFWGSSTAGSAAITNNADLSFNQNSSAGSATITNNGIVYFDGTAASATITTTSGGDTRFFGTSSGGSARFIIGAGGGFDISNLSTSGTTAGSIEGAGRFRLGSKALTVGSNDLSATVGGTIEDGGAAGGIGGALVKVGTGTLTLRGANSFSGGVTISGGTLDVSGDANLGNASGGLTFSGGTLRFGASFDVAATRAISINAAGATFDTNGFDGGILGGISGTGSLTKTGTGTLTLAGAGSYSGDTTVTGGLLSITGTLANANGSIGSVGGVAVSGAGANWTNTGTLRVGDGGNGQLTIEAGGTVTSAEGRVGDGSSASGTVTVNGDGSTWENSGDIRIAKGVVRVEDGGAVSTNGGIIGYQVGGLNNELVVTGEGSTWTSSGSLTVGFREDAELTVENKGKVTSASGRLGDVLGKTGTATVTGAGSLWTSGDLDVGYSGAGALTISDGGAVSSNAATIGVAAGSSGAVVVTGDGSSWTVTNGLSVGSLGSGELTISEGAKVSAAAASIAGILNIGAAVGDTAAAAGAFDVSTVTLAGGTIAFNHTDTDYEFASNIVGSGSVQHSSGTTILNGTNTYSGATTVSGGTLLVNGSITSTLTVEAGGTIGGSGTLGDTFVDGTLSAGNSPGRLTVDGNLTLGVTSTSVFELGVPGTPGDPGNDLVHVTGNLTLGGTLLTPGAVSGYYRLFTVDGSISGSYTTIPTGASVQTGIPNQVNLFVRNGDQIVQFWDGGDSLGNGSVDGGAGTWSAAGTNWTGAPGSATFNDQWHGQVAVFSGAGGVVKVNAPLAFEGLQFSSNGYVLSGDVLTMTGDSVGNAAASFINVTSGASVEIGSVLAGSGIGLDKLGSGTLKLTGVNTYTGATTIQAGTLALSGSGSIADSSLVTVDGVFDIADVTASSVSVNALAGASTGSVRLGGKHLSIADASAEFAGSISGFGGISILNGTQTFSGTNTYSGSTGIASGATLALKDGGSIANSTAVGIIGTGRFDISQVTTGAEIKSLDSLSLDTVVALGSKKLTITVGSQFAGVIRDGGISGGAGGSLVIADGARQALSGANTYTGSTTIEAGGRLDLTGGGSLSASSGIATDGIFDVSGHTTGLGPVVRSLAGEGDIHLGSRQIRIAAANGTFSGGISDCGTSGTDCVSGSTGGSVVLETGTLTLSGTNTYTGGTVVGGSTSPASAFLVVTNEDAVGTGRVLLNEGGVFRAGANGLTFDNAFAVSSSLGTVDTNGHTMTIAGVVSDATDPGTLHKIGAGTLILTANNSYGDGTVVKEGTLQIGAGGTSGSILGEVTLGGTLVFNRSDLYSFAGVISDDGVNAGQVVQRGTGTLELTGTSTYSRGTMVESGTLLLAADAAAGIGTITVKAATVGYANGVTIRNALVVDSATARLEVVSGVAEQAGGISEVSGPRPIEKTGAGVLVLSGDNIYTGGTTVTEGTLRAGKANTFSSGSAFIVAGGAVLDLDGFDQRLGALSGSGTIGLGAGKLTVDQSGDTSFGGDISGSGSFTKQGSGKLMMTGTSSYTGETVVDGGTLSVNGSIAASSGARVGPNATLAGIGDLPSVTMAGGTIAPGNSIGTITVNGNLTFNTGSVYEVEVDASGKGDRINATGTVAINGGSVVGVVLLDPEASYKTSRTYRIIAAGGGVNRNSDFALAQPYLFLDLGLDYGANFVDLTLKQKLSAFSSVAWTYNQRQASTGLAGLAQTGDALAVYNQILGMTDADAARRAFDLASGEIHATGQNVVDHSFGQFLQGLRGQAASGVGASGTGARHLTAYAASPNQAAGSAAIDDVTTEAYSDRRVKQAWLTALGGRGTIGSDGNAAALDWYSGGLAGGYQSSFDEGRGLAGFGMGYMRGRGEINDRLSSMDVDGLFTGVYAGWSGGPWSLSGSLAYGANRTSTERRIVIGGIDRTPEASYWSQAVGFSGEVAYGVDLGDVMLSPVATLDAGWSSHGGFTETGAGALDLTGSVRNRTRLDGGLGVTVQKTFATDSGKLTLEGRVVWEHAFADVMPGRNLSLAGSPVGFEVRGPLAGRDRLRVGAGMAWEIDEGVTLRARYEGVFSGRNQSHDASGGLSLKF